MPKQAALAGKVLQSEKGLLKTACRDSISIPSVSIYINWGQPGFDGVFGQLIKGSLFKAVLL